MSSENKKFKESDIIIGTHDGIFHCDEILACFMLQQLPKYENAKIVRSRNEEILNKCNILVDVGGIFNEQKQRFDHHQKSFEHTFSSLRPDQGNKWKVRLSSAGLIYTYFGEEVIKEMLKRNLNMDISTDCLMKIYTRIYECFIQEIDGIDNGVPMFDSEPHYRITTDLSSRVNSFNSVWNSNVDYNVEEQFEKAKCLVGKEFLDHIIYYASVWWPARSIVQEAISNRFNVHNSGEILELTQFCPWKAHLFELEKDFDIEDIPKYMLIENKPGDFRVICVPNAPNSFVCRKFLNKDWRGVRDIDLKTITGIDDAKFCHATGFIGGCSTRDGCLQMAIKSLEAESSD